LRADIDNVSVSAPEATCRPATARPAAGQGDEVVSVVMPAYNEAELLAVSVTEVAGGLRGRGRRFELIVVENGSDDGTLAIGQGLAAQVPELRLLSLPTADYGAALRTGFLAATGDVVVNFDVDFYDLGFLDRAVALAAPPAGPAIVVGSKRSPGAVDTRPWHRQLVTTAFTFVLQTAFGLRASDTHGVKALRRAPLVGLVEQCRFGADLFDTELILRAQRAGIAAAELPVVVEELRPARSSIARRALRSVLGLARLRLTLWAEGRGSRQRVAA
jgi:Glycosyl transferase family 2